jgi:hypothetical protein
MVNYVTYLDFLMSKYKNSDSSIIYYAQTITWTFPVLVHSHISLVLATYCSIAILYCFQPIVFRYYLNELNSKVCHSPPRLYIH